MDAWCGARDRYPPSSLALDGLEELPVGGVAVQRDRRGGQRLQSGRLDAYLLYMLIALVAVIAVVTALA